MIAGWRLSDNMYRLQVKADALYKRNRIPVTLPDHDGVKGVVLRGFSFVGERVMPAEMPGGATGRWYKDRDGYYYLGEWLIETEELLTAEAPVLATPGFEILEAPPAEILVQTNYNDLLQHIPPEWKLTRGKNVKIAVLDSGFVLHHDLQNNIIQTFNAVNDTTDVAPIGNDDKNHGNNVAGLMAAASTFAEGVLGVAPEAKIIAIKISNKGHINGKNVLKGLEFAINNTQANIINLSLSLDEDDYAELRNKFLALFEKAKSKGTLIIASAGDNTGLLDQQNLLHPASEESCLSIGTVDQDFIANNPAPNFDSSLNYVLHNQSLKSCAGSVNTYSPINNSSMAAAILSGAAALLYSHHNGFSDQETFIQQLNAQLKSYSNTVPLNLSIYKV